MGGLLLVAGAVLLPAADALRRSNARREAGVPFRRVTRSMAVPTAAPRAAAGARAPQEVAAVAAVAPSGHDHVLHAVIVAQRRDCSGNLGMVDLLDRPRLAPHVASRTLLLAGPPGDTLGLRPLLPPALAQADIALLHPNELAFLRHAGHTATPLLLLFDRQHRLQLAAPVPDDPAAWVATQRAITHLLTNSPAH